LEFILLLIIAVGLATLLNSQFIGGDVNACATGDAPVLSQAFCNITRVIGNDIASEIDI